MLKKAQCSCFFLFISMSNNIWVTIKYLTVIVFNFSQAIVLLAMSGSGLSSGGEMWKRAVIGREVRHSLSLSLSLSYCYFPHGDVTKQATTPSRQNMLIFQSVFSNSSYTKIVSSLSQFHSIIIIIIYS